MAPAGTVLSLLLPVVTGWLLVRRLWRNVPLGLSFGLCAPIGLALAGTVYFLTLLIFDSSLISFATSECTLAGLTAVLLWKRSAPRCTHLDTSGPSMAWRSTHPWERRERLSTDLGAPLPLVPFAILPLQRSVVPWFFAATALAGAAAFIFALDSLPHGGWDAFVMWNLRARLIAGTHTSPLSSLFDTAFLGLHPDYPLLLPALVARGFQYAGSALPSAPISLALLFTVSTIVIAITGLRLISTNTQSWTAGCILVSTPLLLDVGASQYADIIVCCFMTAAIVVYAVYDREPAHSSLPIIAGAAAAAAACTKNEGILFLIVLLLSRIAAGFFKQSDRPGRELLAFAAGASLGVLTLAIFKVVYSPPNDTVQLMSARAFASRITDLKLHLDVLRRAGNSLNFGQWVLNPLPWMALYAAVSWKRGPRKIGLWLTPAFVIAGMLCAYYLVYLLSPYDIESHVASSLDRLLLQLWPTAIVLYSVLVAPAGTSQQSRSPLSAGLAVRVAAVLILVAAAYLMDERPLGDRPSDQTLGLTPHIELNRTEVVTGDTYTMKVNGVRAAQVYITYSVDDVPMGQFGAYLGKDGSVDFQVSPSTPRGAYRFLAIRTADDPAWTRFNNDASIVVK